LKAARTFTVPADHPALAGHFPGMPVLPGAALLDAVLHVLEEDLALDPVAWQITTAKFLEPVRPGDVLVVEHSADADVIRFAIRVAKPLAKPHLGEPHLGEPHETHRAALAGTLARKAHEL
jgi:3-hydroxymyristoyl/3-hydroxydecanoyl-(acyl carrier protein) dehydratase